MLYRGSEVIREAAMVVFDEIHYIRDPERGVVRLPHRYSPITPRIIST